MDEQFLHHGRRLRQSVGIQLLIRPSCGAVGFSLAPEAGPRMIGLSILLEKTNLSKMAESDSVGVLSFFPIEDLKSL
jgi:hypothetical protein